LIRNVVGVDLGQQFDFTAISVIQTREIWTTGDNVPVEWKTRKEDRMVSYNYYLRFLERFQAKYPDTVQRVLKIVRKLEDDQGTALVVDATGVGLPVVEMMREERLHPIPIIITGGNTVTEADGGFHLPKRHMISTLQGLFESGRLKISKGINHLEELLDEISNFRVKITKAGNDTYEAWRETDHDDMVMSVAMATWYARRESPQNILANAEVGEGIDEWDPLSDWR
jgi:hypothetical protein